jgi:hypothetical protein
MSTIRFPLRRLSLAALFILFAAGTVQAGPAGAQADAQARYRQEMDFCNSGKSSQPITVCRTEARNAFADARRGDLGNGAGEYSRNALRRCAEFQGDDRTACEARVFGPARIEGSVAGGGVLRESVMVMPVK